MPRGSRPGERRGGRRKGVPNRTTTEQMEIARLAATQGKLGKEVLEEFMVLFKDMALELQPESREAERFAAWLKSSKEAQFHKYASLAVKAAKDLADFQSPKFKAIEVSAPAPTVEGDDGEKVTCFTFSIFNDDLGPKAVEHHPEEKLD
jgi:hypothetical protein